MKPSPCLINLQVRNIQEARDFYGGLLGCDEGRSDETQLVFNFFGHLLTCKLNPNLGKDGKINSYNTVVDGHKEPIPHCGAVLEMGQWNT